MTFAGEPQDMAVDYFSGNVWFYHQEIKAADTAEFELVPMYLKYPRRSWNDLQEVVYARLSLHGFPNDGYYQTFPGIVSDKLPESIANRISDKIGKDSFRIGLLYQELLKLHDMEAGDYDNAMKAAEKIHELYNDPERQRDSWCSDVFAFVPALLSDRNMGSKRFGSQIKQQFQLHDKNIEEYLLYRLAQSHHPEALSVVFNSSSRVRRICRIIWLIVGILGFLIYCLYARSCRKRGLKMQS